MTSRGMARCAVFIAIGSSLVSVGGCPTGLPSGPLGEIVQTAIPPAIYTGEATYHFMASSDGTTISDETETEPYSEVVDENGLPLLQPDGVAPRKNLVTTQSLAGITLSLKINSVSAFGDRLVIAYTATFILDNIELSGIGTYTYEFVEPDTLNFTDQFSGVSNRVNGKYVGFSWTGRATLTK